MNNDDRILICVVYRNGLSTHGDDDDGNENENIRKRTHIPRVQERKKATITPSMLPKCVGDKRQ